MIELTVGDLLDGNLDELALEVRDHNIYIVRDNKTVLYVGRSWHPVDRLWGHLGRGNLAFGSSSEAGRFIKVNLPESREWQIQLLTIADCEPYFKQCWWRGRNDMRLMRDSIVKDCEDTLIWHYRPCFNIQGNQGPGKRTPLPEHYKTPWSKIIEVD